MRAHGRMISVLLFTVAAALWQGCESGGGGDASGYGEEECATACNRLGAASCGDVGQGCFDQCVSFPMAQLAGDCQVELRAYLDCFWHAESFTCDGGVTTPVGCDAPRQGYLACVGQGEGGAPGAGGATGEPLGGAGTSDRGGARQGGAGAEAVAAGSGSGGAPP